ARRGGASRTALVATRTYRLSAFAETVEPPSAYPLPIRCEHPPWRRRGCRSRIRPLNTPKGGAYDCERDVLRGGDPAGRRGLAAPAAGRGRAAGAGAARDGRAGGLAGVP